MPEIEEQINTRKQAKKEKRKANRKKRLKRWGTVGIVLAIVLVAVIVSVVKVVESYDNKYSDYEEIIKTLSETINVDDLTENKISSQDYSSFLQKCSDGGINISNSGSINKDETALIGDVLISGNELGAYVNRIMEEDAFDIIEVSLYRSDGADYIKTVSAIKISEINQEAGSQSDMPEFIYITTTSELYRFGNSLELRNSTSRINNLSDSANDLIFNAILGDEFADIDGIMNAVIVEKVGDFMKACSGKLGLVVDDNKILLKISPSE